MDKNVFNIVEPAYEPLTEQEAAKIRAAVIAKTGATAAPGQTACEPRRTAKSTTHGARGRHGRRIAVLAIAAVLAFGVVAFASTAIDPNSPLLALFNINGEQLDEQEGQLIQSSGTLIGKTVEKNGVKIHVKEAIGDKDTVYLLVDVTLPKDAVKPGMEYGFERVDLREALPSLIGSGVGATGWTSSSGEPSEDGTFPFIISATASNGVQGKAFILDLNNLQRALKTDSTGEASGTDASSSSSAEDSGLIETFGAKTGDNGEIIEYKMTTDEDGNIIDYVSGAAVDGNVDGNLMSGDNPFETVVEGDWKVKFTLDYADNSVKFNVDDEELNIGGDSYRLTDIRVSPLSISYTIDGGKTVNADIFSNILDQLTEAPIIIRMKDGAEYNFTEDQTDGSSMSNGNIVTKYMRFPRVIDPAQVESITIGDHEVKR